MDDVKVKEVGDHHPQKPIPPQEECHKTKRDRKGRKRACDYFEAEIDGNT